MEGVLYVPSRGRALRIRVKPGGVAIVSVPHATDHHVAEKFVQAHASWIYAAQMRMKEVVQLPSLPRSKKEYESLRQDLLRDMQERVRRIEERLHVAHTRMVVRRARTRWGSCSRRGTISFSAHLAFLPAEVREYVAVHEVCHLVEHNHSRAFWELVRTLCPEYDVHKKTLRRFRM